MVDPSDAARRMRAENAREAEILKSRRERAREIGKDLARKLSEGYPEIGRVWGFGSVFETWRDYRMGSDIDLAVESGDVLALMRVTEDAEFPVDVVDLSDCEPSFADFIRSQGTILAEAHP
jgi:hypothetical protein